MGAVDLGRLAPPSRDPAIAFAYVDTATGGVNRRNRVLRLADYRPPPAIADCFATYFRFAADIVDYAAGHRHPRTGGPSVAGYPGAAWTPSVYADFDCAADPDLARADAVAFVERLLALGAPETAIRAYWSGKKGFGVEIAAALFGGFAPSPDLADRVKAIALRLLDGLPTADVAIYEKLRLLRLPNTRHGESRLFKIELALGELVDWDLDVIRTQARSLRTLDLPTVGVAPVPALIAMWDETAAPRGSNGAGRQAAAAAEGTPIPEGQRNATLASLAGTMRQRGMTQVEMEAALLVANADRCHPPLPEDEVRTVARSISRYAPAPSPSPIRPDPLPTDVPFTQPGPDGDVDPRFARFAANGDPANRAIEQASGLRLTRLADLLAEPPEETDYVVDDTLPAGGLGLLAAKPKVGKSTLARALAVAVAAGTPFLGRATARGPVVYLALEEKRSEVAKHFARMGAADEPIFVHVGAAPQEALAALAEAIAEHRPVLAIVDPLLKLIRLRDANDYAQVSAALEPLIELARRSGCHILCVHHLGKGERGGGDAILGSTALFGAVDAALLMKRREDQRVIESIQRYGVDLPETVVRLDPITGVAEAAGEVAALQLADVGARVLDELGHEEITEPEIKDRVGGNQTVTAKAVRQLVEDGRVLRAGGGKKGDPYRYRASSDVLASKAAETRFAGLVTREHPANRANRLLLGNLPSNVPGSVDDLGQSGTEILLAEEVVEWEG